MALDERLRRELDGAAQPADPSGVYDNLIRRRERRRITRKAQTGVLTVVVVIGSLAGFYALTRVFGSGTRIGSPAPPNGAIAFVVYGPSEDPSIPAGSTIFAVNPDGSGRVELARAEGPVTDLDWSPDGQRLVYGRHDLFVLDLDSGMTTRVVVPGSEGYSPSWSPDGSQIALAVAQAKGYAIYAMRPDGSDATLLTEAQDLGWTDWSPDGSRILFVGPGPQGAYEGWDIYVMNADGSDVTNLTNSPTVDLDPSWSPDGATILFRSRRDPPPGWTNGDAPDELYLMAPDGSDVRRLTNDDAVDQSPVWSPDGTRIAFTSATPNGDSVVYTMRPDGTDKTKLPGVLATVTVIAWQPLTTGGAVVPEPSPGETIVPEPTPSPTPPVSEGRDIGLGFPVCNVTSVSGVFAPGVDGSAFVATKAGDTGGCSRSGVGFQVVAIDFSGDGLADASYGPLECETWCSAFAAPDVDGDGTDELLIQNIEFTIVGLRLYEVSSDPRPEVFPVTVAPPGDAPFGFQGFEGGEEPQFWIGGDAFIGDSIRCEATEAGRVLISMTGESRPHDSPDARWFATETTFILEGSELRVLDVKETIDDPLAFVTTGCGADLDIHG